MSYADVFQKVIHAVKYKDMPKEERAKMGKMRYHYSPRSDAKNVALEKAARRHSKKANTVEAIKIHNKTMQ